jgi:phage tail-like protein
MIFNSAEKTLDYLEELLHRDITVTKKDFLKICSVNGVTVSKATFEHANTNIIEVARVSLLEDKTFSVVYYHDAWIKKLPEIYHDNEFLSRFLFGFQQEYLETQSALDTISDQFKPEHTDFIDWLASWAGIAFSDNVSENAKRRVLQNIVRLYKIRGTRRYYIELIRYLTDITVQIEDVTSVKKIHNNLVKKAVSVRYFKINIVDSSCTKEQMKDKISLMGVVINQHKPVNVEFSVYCNNSLQTLHSDLKEKFVDMHSEDSSGYEY